MKLAVLADGAPRNTGPDFGKAGPLGLLVIVLLLLAVVFLVRSMNRQLKKVPKSFDGEHPGRDQAGEGTDPVETTGNGEAQQGYEGRGESPHEPDD